MNEWNQVRFGDLLSEPVRNGIYKSKEFHGKGSHVVNMGELFAHPRLKTVEMNRVMLTDREKEKSLLRNNDLIFARRSLTAEGAGKCSLVYDLTEETTFESSIIRARPDQSLANSEFLFYYFNSLQGKHLLGTILRQVAVSGITGSDLTELILRIPPLEEQKAIAKILSAFDDKIELNRRMNATLEAMARALFKAWFVDFEPVHANHENRPSTSASPEIAKLFPSTFENRIPKGWEVKSLNEAFEINPLRSLKRGAVAKYLDMASVPTSGHRVFGVIDRPFSSGTKFKNGDTLLARITPCLENGKTAFVDFLRDETEIAWGSTEFVVLRPKNGLPSYFAYLLCRNQDFRNFAVQSMTGTSGRQRVQTDSLAKFSIIVPPTQSKIGAEFGLLVKPITERMRLDSEEVTTLTQVRDSLLPRLISGKVKV